MSQTDKPRETGGVLQIEAQFAESAKVINSLIAQSDILNSIIGKIKTAILGGGCIYCCGNGGSSCDSMHFVEECVARYQAERPGIRAMHLCDPAIMSCWANDYCFDDIFKRQVETFVTEKDILIAFSTSGNSKNVVKALKAANIKNAVSIALLGKDGGKAKDLASISLVVDSTKTSHIQEAHIATVHNILEQLENDLF